jgi:hypothetical protein
MSVSWKVLGHDADLSIAPHVILLNYIKNNWNLADPPKHTNLVHGIKFGQQYSGQHDIVLDCELVSGTGVTPLFNGWSGYSYMTEIRIVVTVVDFAAGGITYPEKLRNIWNYLEAFFRTDPHGLDSSEGISAVNVTSVAYNVGSEFSTYEQQVFTMEMFVQMIYAKATTVD